MDSDSLKYLTHQSLGMWLLVWNSKFANSFVELMSWTFPVKLLSGERNIVPCISQYRFNVSGNGLVLSSDKLLTEPMLSKIYCTLPVQHIWWQMASLVIIDIFNEIVWSNGSNWLLVSIGSGNGLVMIRHQGSSHYLDQWWPRSIILYGITRPKWVDILGFLFLYW